MARNEPSARYDVAVVGGGPGGSATAWALATAGFSVALIDADRFPRDKPCGDGLTTTSLTVLHEMGLEDLFAPESSVQGIAFHGLNAAAAMPITNRTIPLDGLVIPRKILDCRLVQRSCSAGAELLEGTTVRDVRYDEAGCHLSGTRDGSPFALTARFLVGADGPRSLIARRTGLMRTGANQTGVALRGYFTTSTTMLPAFHIVLPLTGVGVDDRCAGYGWMFPVSRNVVNLGIGYFPIRAEARLPNPRAVFARFLADVSAAQICPDPVEIGPVRGGLLASGCEPERCYNGRTLLVGDAAGLVDPLTGEGIDAALGSGLLAAEVLAANLRSGAAPNLSPYAAALRRRFTKRIVQGDQLRKSYPLLLKVAEQATRSDGHLFTVAARGRNGRTSENKLFAVDPALPVLDRTRHILTTELDQVEAELQATIEHANPFLWSLARKLVDPRASSLRLVGLFLPGLTRTGRIGNAARRAACALEFCKLGLEFHGLVESGSTTLASSTRTDHKWTNGFAIMAGDFMLAEAYRLLAKLDPVSRAMVARVAAAYCGARIERLHRSGHMSSSVAAELALAEATLGGLVGLAWGVGAHLGGVMPAAVTAIERAGTRIGVAACIAAEVAELCDGESGAAAYSARLRYGDLAIGAALLRELRGDLAQFELQAAHSAAIPEKLTALIALQLEPLDSDRCCTDVGLEPLVRLMAGHSVSSPVLLRRVG